MLGSFLNREDPADDASELFHLRCDRHDKDRVEIAVGFDNKSQGNKRNLDLEIDLLLFSPKTLGLSELSPVEVLKQELQSYVRLHSYTARHSQSNSHAIVLNRIRSLHARPNRPDLKLLSVELDAYLKGSKRKIKKLSKHASNMEPEMLEMLSLIESILDDFRRLLSEHRAYVKEPASEGKKSIKSFRHDLLLLNEYVSHLYTHILLGAEGSTQFLDYNSELKKKLRSMIKKEAELRDEWDFYILDVEKQIPGSAHEDFYLRRISLLKKYFSRPLYLQTKGNDLEKKMLLPVYGVSAALAAAWAIGVQVYAMGGDVMRIVSMNTAAIVSIAILAYVVKDILKDFFRKFFMQSSRRFFPDVEEKLFMRSNGKDRLLARSKDFVRFLNPSELHPDLAKLRYKGELGSLEKKLGEDVFFHRKRMKVKLKNLDESDAEHPWGYREIIRFRLDRLMVSMEDAYKKLPLLTKGGEIILKSGHRVYQIHVLVQARVLGQEHGEKQSVYKAFRIRLDKEGILDVEKLKWKHSSDRIQIMRSPAK